MLVISDDGAKFDIKLRLQATTENKYALFCHVDGICSLIGPQYMNPLPLIMSLRLTTSAWYLGTSADYAIVRCLIGDEALQAHVQTKPHKADVGRQDLEEPNFRNPSPR